MEKETFERVSERMNEALFSVTLAVLPAFLAAHRADMLTSAQPFADYMRRKIREKGLLQQNVFLAADLGENYGYKLISGEKRTRKRDVILRLCLAAHLTLPEVREALILYGMAPLHGRFRRDAAVAAAINSAVFDLREVNRVLIINGCAPLLEGYEE